MRRVGRCAGYVTPKPLSVPSGLRTWTSVTGEPCETEKLMHGSEGGRRKRASGNQSNSPPAYPTNYTHAGIACTYTNPLSFVLSIPAGLRH